MWWVVKSDRTSLTLKSGSKAFLKLEEGLWLVLICRNKEFTASLRRQCNEQQNDIKKVINGLLMMVLMFTLDKIALAESHWSTGK